MSTSVPLPLVPPTAPAPPRAADRGAAWLRAARRARQLSWLSLGWMAAEGVIGLWSGLAVHSLGLVAWASTSVVEGLASAVVIWRFTGSRTHADTAERTAGRIVAASLGLIALLVVADAVRGLLGHHDPHVSVPGAVVSGGALVVMPLLARAKRSLGRRLGSPATSGEAAQNDLCAYQSAAVLASMGLLALSGSLGFVDPLAAIAVAGLAAHEARATWNGAAGCCSSPLELELELARPRSAGGRDADVAVAATASGGGGCRGDACCGDGRTAGAGGVASLS